MNIILFLGSGVSIASGHPSTEEITKDILDIQVDTTEANFLRALSDYDKKARLLGGYKGHDGELYRDSTSYEDLYFLCQEIYLFHIGLHSHSMVPAFMQSLSKNLFPSTECSLLELGKLAYVAKKYIDKVIFDKLRRSDTIKGLDLIIQIANNPLVTSLNILTLNHDILVEEMLMRNGIDFSDGFGIADGDVRWYNPEFIKTDKKVNVIKLHGSVDWYAFHVDRNQKLGKIPLNKLDECKDLQGNILKFYFKDPRILSGLNKFGSYNSGMFTDIHYHFQRILYENNLMIMSGYGWGDGPINARLLTWLEKKKENKLILLHENPELLKKRSMSMDSDYSNLLDKGKIIPILKWLENTTLEEVMDACE